MVNTCNVGGELRAGLLISSAEGLKFAYIKSLK